MDRNPGKDAEATSAPSTLTQIHTQFTLTLAAADTNAAQSVQELKLVHQARLSQLSRTAASLKAQYGADDPQVKAAEAAVAATTATVARVAMVNQQLTTPVPQVAKNGWALQGRVFDSQLQPVSGFTVFLVDSQKAYQKDFGFAYTDKTGYFLLSFAGTATASQTAPRLLVEVADSKGQPVYLSSTPFQPAAGSVTYQNVTLPPGNQPIGDPPEAIRQVALPEQERRGT